MRGLLAVAALLLAGCTGEAPPLVAGEPTFTDAEVPAGSVHAPFEWATLAEGSGLLAPASPIRSTASVPEHAISVFVNLTLEQGAGSGFLVVFGGCQWQREVVLLGTGGDVVADCGGVLPGASDLMVAIEAGALTTSWRIVALTCMPSQGTCPARLPVTRG
jgi:hypothetical protein